jgi:hypothetical protein
VTLEFSPQLFCPKENINHRLPSARDREEQGWPEKGSHRCPLWEGAARHPLSRVAPFSFAVFEAFHQNRDCFYRVSLLFKNDKSNDLVLCEHGFRSPVLLASCKVIHSDPTRFFPHAISQLLSSPLLSMKSDFATGATD